MSNSKLIVNIVGEKELLKMFKALGNDKVRIKELNSFLRKAAKPILKAQRANIRGATTDNEGFEVYRNGRKYAKTSKEQLAKSIGILKFKGKKRKSTGFALGPRLDGVWSKPNKGGWFGWFFEYGTKKAKTGKGKINIQAKPFTNTGTTSTAVNFAISEVMNKESKAIESTMKRFKKTYNFQ